MPSPRDKAPFFFGRAQPEDSGTRSWFGACLSFHLGAADSFWLETNHCFVFIMELLQEIFLPVANNTAFLYK